MTEWTQPFESVLLVEGTPTPLRGWMVHPGALRLPDVPMPLRNVYGDIVGRVDAVWRDGNRIMASGVRLPAAADEFFGPDDCSYSLDADIHDNTAQTITDATIKGVVVMPRPVVRRFDP